MSSRTLQFAIEQSAGAGPQSSVQHDRARLEYVKTRAGREVMLGVIADGEGGREAGRAAEQVIDQVFRAVRESTNDSYLVALQRGLRASSQALLREPKTGAHVAALAVVLWKERLFWAQVGHTAGYRVREGKVLPLARRGDGLLGQSPEPDIHLGDARGEMIAPGEVLVLATDGLVKPSHEDNLPYVAPDEIPRLTEGAGPKEAARHLISVAMGRDVADNVTVAVIRRPAKKRIRLLPLAAVLGVLLMAALGLAAGDMFFEEPESTTLPAPDVGSVVLIEGAASVRTGSPGAELFEPVGMLRPLPAGALLRAEADSRFALQVSQETGGEKTAATLYLGGGSVLQLDQLDLQSSGSGPRGDADEISVFTLQSGRLLIISDGSDRSYYVRVEDGSVVSVGPGRVAVGVVVLGETLQVDCLRATCLLAGTEGQEWEVLAGFGAEVHGAEIGDRGRLAESVLEAWAGFCRSCLTPP